MKGLADDVMDTLSTVYAVAVLGRKEAVLYGGVG